MSVLGLWVPDVTVILAMAGQNCTQSVKSINFELRII